MNLPFLALPPGLGAMATTDRRLGEEEGEDKKSLLLVRNWREELGLEDKVTDEGVKKDEESFLGLGDVMEEEEGDVAAWW